MKTLIKSLLYRVYATLILWTVLFIYTGKLVLSTEITIISLIVSTSTYYSFEKLYKWIKNRKKRSTKRRKWVREMDKKREKAREKWTEMDYEIDNKLSGD